MRRLLAALMVVLIAAGCSEPGTAVFDGEGILGTYTVNGVDVAGEEYSGTVVIDAIDGSDEYLIRWLISGALQEGRGVLTGDVFEVRWSTISSPAGDVTGTGRYLVEADGDLVGNRTIDGVEGLGTETIFQEA